MKWKDLKREIWNNMSFWQKARYLYWKTPLSLFWWEDKWEFRELYLMKYKEFFTRLTQSLKE